jgi:UDP-3-O-[3-hydroxymyristoyl] glucosamine N-acyltransferase
MRKEVDFMKKYELTDETKEFEGKTLYRIRALIDFGNIEAGDLGGWIEKEENLSHEGNCWIYDNAKVYDDALVYGNAQVYDNAWVRGNVQIYGNARVYDYARVYDGVRVYGDAKVYDYVRVYGNAQICDNAWVCGHARVCGNALIYGNTMIYGNARVCDDAHIYDNAKVCNDAYIFGNACIYGNAQVCNDAYVYDNARVCGNANVFGNAQIYGNAQICDNACIYSNARVCDNARVCENMQVSYSYAKTDLRKDIAASLRCQCNLLLTNNKVIAYKIVNKNLSSLYNENFIYEVGKIAEVKDAEESNESCANGLHFSNLTYWDSELREYTDKTYLVAEIDVEDIITIQQGKIRCRKAKILDKVDII